MKLKQLYLLIIESNMNRSILNQAFIGMGYRQLTHNNLGNIYGKPIGFGMIIAQIENNHKEISMKTLFRRYNDGKIGVWGSSKIDIDFTNPKVGYETLEGEDLYNEYIKSIAYGEYEASAEKVITPVRGKPFAFVTNNDVMSFFNI